MILYIIETLIQLLAMYEAELVRLVCTQAVLKGIAATFDDLLVVIASL